MSRERLRWLRTKLSRLFRRKKQEAALAAELQFHFDQLVAQFRADGLAEPAARRAAQREFGATEVYREETRDTWRPPALADVGRSVRFAIRSLARAPGFTLIAIVTLALGIGANTAMFSVLNTQLLRPLSLPEPENLFALFRTQQPADNIAFGNYLDIAAAADEFADMAAFRTWGSTLSEAGKPADAPFMVRVTGNYFRMMGQKAAHGRLFFAAEDAAGRNAVIVISHRYWQSRFAGDPGVIGHTVKLDGEPVEIVGVLPSESDTARLFGPIDVYRPYGASAAERANRTENDANVIGRYRDQVNAEQAVVRFNAIAERLAADHPAADGGLGFEVRTFQSLTLRGTGRFITILLVGLSGFVLLIACVNLANLLLARAISRRREFSVRAALGASRGQLLGPVAWECLLLATAGGLAATLVSVWTTSWFGSIFGDGNLPAVFAPDHRVFLFTLVVTVVAAFLFGLAPAWWTSRIDANQALAGGGRRATESRSQGRYRRWLITFQFAFSMVLLVGAGLFLRGLDRLADVAHGWEPDRVVIGTVNLPGQTYDSAEAINTFHRSLHERLRALPGVESASASYTVPMFPSPTRRNYVVAGREPAPPGQQIIAETNGVTSEFFATMGMHILQGRAIDATAQPGTAPEVVINESMAHALFPDGDVLSQRLSEVGAEGARGWAEIVGVVADTRPMQMNPDSGTFRVYKPYTQESWGYVTIAVRSKPGIDPASLVDPIRRTVGEVDAELPVLRLRTVTEQVATSLRTMYGVQHLLSAFAGIGLALAALGIYGVIARAVAQRTNEIGIRMALGARAADILRLVVAMGLRTALIGATLGILGAAGLGRFIASHLATFGGGTTPAIVISATLLLTVALIACYLPARRATRVDPATALRTE